MTIKIKHPEPSPGEVSAVGVTFVDGEALIPDLDADTVDALTLAGFSFEAVEETEDEAGEEEHGDQPEEGATDSTEATPEDAPPAEASPRRTRGSSKA